MAYRYSIILLLLCSFSFTASGCNLLNSLPDKPDQTDKDKEKDQDKDKDKPGPSPKPDEKYSESDYWEALADLVEAGRFTNTDQIVLVVDSQKTLGNIKDDSRVGEYRAKRSDVSDANKNFIANKIRGN